MFKKIMAIFITLALFTSVQAKSLIPGGESAGVVLTYDGVLVTGNYAFLVDGEYLSLNKDRFQEGDLIVSCHNQKIKNVEDLINSIQSSINSNKEIIVQIKRDNDLLDEKLDVYFDYSSNTFKTGLYIIDHTTAIGTITFYDPETHTFGAFGHKVDVNQEQLNFDSSELFESYVTSIERNTSKAIGKKNGSVEYSKKIGDIYLNTDVGIFGKYQNIYKQDHSLLDTNEPKVGIAYIYTTLEDNILYQYEIYIDEVTNNELKNIIFHVTDETLILKTNGIIPGMSGSPIIQDGYIVGAVTHVLVNQPKKGYGINIENMLEVAR